MLFSVGADQCVDEGWPREQLRKARIETYAHKNFLDGDGRDEKV